MPLPHNWTSEDILALSLARIKGPLLRRLVEQCMSLDEAVAAADSAQGGLFADGKPALLRERAEQQAELCSRTHVRILTLWHEQYPVLLREIYYPPPVLFVRGELQSADALAVAVVGTRRCTAYGRLTTERFATAFAQSGAVVVSGLATGIDTVAHKAALSAGGATYAVIASGIDAISPYSAERLACDISDNGGAVISEYACGVRALPAYFPQRNRIISGIAQATVVVESRTRGGALITAGFAIDQDRELFAVPGAITSETSSGTNTLIKNSQAAPALSPEDVMHTLGIRQSAQPVAQSFAGWSHGEQQVYTHIGPEPLHIDTIAERSGTPVHDVLVYLLELEFRGAVRQLPGKQFVRM